MLSPTQCRSEVARLLRQIDKEFEASQRALESPAMVGGHAFLTARQVNIAKYFEELAVEVGSKEEAMKLIAYQPSETHALPC